MVAFPVLMDAKGCLRAPHLIAAKQRAHAEPELLEIQLFDRHDCSRKEALSPSIKSSGNRPVLAHASALRRWKNIGAQSYFTEHAER